MYQPIGNRLVEWLADVVSKNDEKVEELVAQKAQEQIAEVPESVKSDTVDRKEELSELLKTTAEKMTPAKKTKEMGAQL